MATQVFPLPFNVPIVDPATGFPTPFFTNMIQQWLAEKAITDGQAQGAAIAGDAVASGITSAAHTVLGNKEAAAGAIEELTASQVLDLIGSTRGQILFRGAAGWSALAPGTSGNFLKTNGAGADPAWDVASGGGGAWTVAATWTWSTNVTVVKIAGLAAYSDLLVFIKDITTSASAFRFLQASVDGGTTFFATSGDYKAFTAGGIPSNAGDMCGHSSAQTGAVSMWCRIRGNIANAPKIFTNDTAHGYVANASMVTNVINAVGLGTTAGNITGGSITVLGR